MAPPPLKFVPAERAPADAVDRIYAGTLDGVVWRRVLAASSCARAALRVPALHPQMRALYPDPAAPQTLGTMLAPTLLAPRGPDLADYFRDVQADEALLAETLGDANWHASVREAVADVSGGRDVQVLDDPRPHRSATLRVMSEGYGAGYHVDTYAPSPSFEHLHRVTDRSVQLSWYVVVQSAIGGGELRVHSQRRPGEPPPASETTVVPLGVGDLVLFDGSNLHHLVTPTIGPQARMTLGGFGGISARGRRVYLWG